MFKIGDRVQLISDNVNKVKGIVIDLYTFKGKQYIIYGFVKYPLYRKNPPLPIESKYIEYDKEYYRVLKLKKIINKLT